MRLLDALNQHGVTIGLCAAGVLVYLVNGPIADGQIPGTLAQAFAAVLLHGNLSHLVLNTAIIALAGPKVEGLIGTVKTALLVASCIFGGTMAQYLVVGPEFAGLSGAAYGLMGFAVLASAPQRALPLVIAAVVVILGLEMALLSDGTAIYTHGVSACIGGSVAMFGSLFGSKEPTLKPMKVSHLARVVAIIAQTDEDDAAEAEDMFLSEGYGGMFVLEHRGEVLGVTGYAVDDQVHDICWLSWTYLSEDHTGRGLGSQMLNDLLGMLKSQGIRKLFIATSDYEEDGALIYGAAHKMYEDFGAQVEMTLADYHEPGEAKIVYGLRNPEYGDPNRPQPSNQTGIAITGAAKEPEANGVAGLIWTEAQSGVAGLDHTLEQIRRDKARMAVLALPGDLSDQNRDALVAHGFVNSGRLENYFADGLHQEWWMCSLGAN